MKPNLRKSISCPCGKLHRFATLDRIIIQRYVEPYGCTGGDHFIDGESGYRCPALKRIVFFSFLSIATGDDQRICSEDIRNTFFKIYKNSWKSTKRIHKKELEKEFGKNFQWINMTLDVLFAYGVLRTVSRFALVTPERE